MKYRYTVIHDSGHPKVYDGKTLAQVFDDLFADHQVGGSTFDHSNALYQDGKLIVPHGLSTIVSRLGYMKRDAMKDVYDAHEKAIANAIAGMDKL
jgi:hypothetical protein